MIFYDGICNKCGDLVEFRSTMENRDNPRVHSALEDTDCSGSIERRPCSNFATRWHYGKNDKKGCLLSPSQVKYPERNKIKNSRIVSGPSYSGPTSKEKGP